MRKRFHLPVNLSQTWNRLSGEQVQYGTLVNALAFSLIGSGRSHNSCSNENVALKSSFGFVCFSMLVTWYIIGNMYFHLLVMNGLQVKAENERFTAAGS